PVLLDVLDAALGEARAELKRVEGLAGARGVVGRDAREFHARGAGQVLLHLAGVLDRAGGDRGGRHGHDAHLVAVLLARGEIGLLALGGEPEVGGEAQDREEEEEEKEARQERISRGRSGRARRGPDSRGWWRRWEGGARSRARRPPTGRSARARSPGRPS